MKIFNKIVWSKKEPSNKNDIWFDGSTFRAYTEGSWDIIIQNNVEGNLDYIRTLYDSTAEDFTEEQREYNKESYRLVMEEDKKPTFIAQGLIGTPSKSGWEENPYVAVQLTGKIYYSQFAVFDIAATVQLREDGSVTDYENAECLSPEVCDLSDSYMAAAFFAFHRILAIKGICHHGEDLCVVDVVGKDMGFEFVEYNHKDKRYRVGFDKEYNVVTKVEIPLSSGGSIDPELLEGYMPLSRDFSDDFNNDFTR